MRTQLQRIESIEWISVVWIVNHQDKFITRLHSCIVFIFLDIRLEACSFTKNKPPIGIFQVFGVQFHLATVRAATFKNTSFSQNNFNGCISCFSCSMIQEIIKERIKLEAAYNLHGQCHYLHISSQLGTLKRSEIKLSIWYPRKPALNFEKRTRPEKDSAKRLTDNEYN